jgi:hypothetical protein
VTRNRFVLLAVGVLVVAFAVGLAWGLSAGSGGGTPAAAPSASAAGSPAGPELPALYTDCRPRTVPSGSGWTCGSAQPGVDEVLVTRWPDPAAMATDFAATYGRKPDGKCGSYRGQPAAGFRSTWGNGKPLACYLNSNGAAVVLWEVPDRALQLFAVRKDGDAGAAFGWWQQAVKTPL